MAIGRKAIELYSDFPMTMDENPVSGDLTRITNENSVKQSIRNLLLTDRGERLFQPNLGSDIRALLFENISADTLVLIQEKVKDTIEIYEPRCNLISVDATSAIDDNTVNIRVLFNVINITQPIELNVTLSRVR